ncbi:succinate-semialdehyde dehydrogenase [Cryobacterium roopkundense]|uniref:Succinate-semialdehyde dehydrogenase n=1 Tax=Cryobacterium roopkundense TaxID=1001240 RepID=A0A099J565_9MICO|nr:NAD-dependent succinate-semialdehyde dehydrogenase [Cryobacterium roopkundense]KGJ72588.1 succinate-semialdehyde dehydrogenase [Cryobacterium roopkundense]MBB5642893.1 succinate-semialdehyde dehydrogenase/glutarate-semialdehyde dehydrogenase [Cryobacterium roopkundense]
MTISTLSPIDEIIARVPTGLFIGGAVRSASDGAEFDVVDPATGKMLARVASGTVDDAIAAVDAAQAAAVSWAQTPPRQRSIILSRAFELMTAAGDDLASLIVAENGKIFADARGEVAYAAEFLRWYAEEAVRIPGTVQTAPGGTNKILVTHHPVGIAVLVTPWNFPAAMATRKIGPALAAGCTVILKPASETPLTALAIARIFEQAGVPSGVVNVLPTRRSGEVVEAMVNDGRVRKLSFTGSTEVGITLMQLAARTVVNTSMELGGNAPFIVFDDADLDEALDGAMIAKMRNGGEACTAANRFYVQEGVAAEFGRRLAARMGSLRVGPGRSNDSQLGPVINGDAREDIHRLVCGAVEEGASLLIGGDIPGGEGYFYPATVLVDVPAASSILNQEIFGPVAPIVTFRSEADAVRLANGTAFGLVSYVYTRDLARGLRVSEQIECGMVGLNRGLVSDPAAPFGGMKQSGIGREGGAEGLLEYLESQYIAVSW